MKQGSTDDPFSDEPATDTEQQRDDEDEGSPEEQSTQSLENTSEPTLSDNNESRTTTPQRQALPYIHSRDGVKDGRKQRPIFLREHIEEGIDDLVDQMEVELDEDVYKTDVTEAAMAIAEENPKLVLEKLEEWGYGWT